MKKLISSLMFVLMFSTIVYAFDIVPKVSIDLPSTFKTDYEVKVSMTLSAEARFQLSEYFSVGGGLEYLIPRTTTDKLSKHDIDAYYGNKDFYFAPVYATVILYPLGNFGEYKPYIKVDGGYNVLFGITDGKDSSGGLYVGGAIGFELFERYILEVTGSRYEAKDNNEDITYKKIGFKVGYKFSI